MVGAGEPEVEEVDEEDEEMEDATSGVVVVVVVGWRGGAGVRHIAARIPPYSKEEHATPPPARQPRVSLIRLTSCP